MAIQLVASFKTATMHFSNAIVKILKYDKYKKLAAYTANNKVLNI